MDDGASEGSLEISLSDGGENGGGQARDVPSMDVVKGSKRPQADEQPSTSYGAADSSNALSLNNQLRSLLNAGGGLKSDAELEPYFKLCLKANTWDRRRALLAALHAASQEVLSAFVSQRGMHRVLEGWLEEALAAKTNAQCVSNILTTLSRLPATKEALIKPCTLPIIVNNITKNADVDSRTISESRMIIAKWRKLFPSKKKQQLAASSGPHQAQKPKGAPGAVADGVKTSQQQTKPEKAQEQSEPGKPRKRKSDSNNNQLFEDVDVFAAQKRSANTQETSSDARKIISASTANTGAAKGTTRVRVVASNAALSQTNKSQQPKATQVARVSANPLDMLGMRQGEEDSATAPPEVPKRQRRIALSRAPDPLPATATAAERAKAAADRVPDDPPREKKVLPPTKRKVVWADGWGPQTAPAHPEKLIAERTFLKDDPPDRASADAVFDERARAAIAGAQQDLHTAHQQFEIAARKQHHSEAQALKEFKAMEDKERREVEQRVRELRPSFPWGVPPNIPREILEGLGKRLQPARGGESTEVSNRKRVRHSLQPASHALESPEEPPPGSNVPIRPLHLIRKIPLSIEEASSAQVARQRPVEQQQGSQQRAQSAGPRRMLGLHGLHGPGSNDRSHENTQGGMAGPGAPQASGRPGQVPPTHGPPGPGPRGNSICKFFNSPGGCNRGDTCYFQHIPNGPAQRPMRRPTSGPPTGARRPMRR